MIKSIQFSEGVLCLAVNTMPLCCPSQRERRVKLDLSKGCTIAEIHGGEFVDLVKAIDRKAASEIGNLVLELLRTETGICRIELDLLYCARKRLQRS